MMDDDALWDLYQVETDSYYEWQAERSGSPVASDRRNSRPISPKRTREAHARWQQAIAALRAAGGTPERVRDMLQARVGESHAVRRA